MSDVHKAALERAAGVADAFRAEMPERLDMIGYRAQIAAAIRALMDAPANG